MNLQRNRQGLLPAASQCCPVQSGYVALPSQGKATKVKKRVHFSKLVTVIKSEYSLSAEERRETWWQREDYCGFKWEIALQLRAPRQRLLVGTDNAVPKAEQIASDIKEESDVEDLLQSLTFDTVSSVIKLRKMTVVLELMSLLKLSQTFTGVASMVSQQLPRPGKFFFLSCQKKKQNEDKQSYENCSPKF